MQPVNDMKPDGWTFADTWCCGSSYAANSRGRTHNMLPSANATVDCVCRASKEHVCCRHCLDPCSWQAAPSLWKHPVGICLRMRKNGRWTVSRSLTNLYERRTVSWLLTVGRLNRFSRLTKIAVARLHGTLFCCKLWEWDTMKCRACASV